MDPSRKRFLLIAVLIGLALAIPAVLDLLGGKPEPQAAPAQDPPEAEAAEPAQPTPPPAARPPQHDPARAAAQRLATIETDEYLAQVTNLNGGLTRFELKSKRFRTDGQPLDIVTTDKERYLPLAIEVAGLPEAPPAFFELSQLSPAAVLLSGEAGDVRVQRKLEAGKGPYQLWLTTHLENRGDAPRKLRLAVATHHWVTREAEGATIPLAPVRNAPTSHGLCLHEDDLERLDRKTLLAPHRFARPIAFAGVENVFFLNAMAPDQPADVEACRLHSEDRHDDEGNELGSVFSTRVEYREVELAPGEGRTYRTLAYLGPKSPDELAAAGRSLKRSIESGWFTSLAEGLTWLLRAIHDFVGNWGIAIILLTFIVKLVLYPLTAKQMASMARMKELKPELDRINELYGDDREKKGAAIMELYRKRGVNPMAGCFPMLLQLPIWFSLYASLSSNVELFRAPFALWWQDLSSPDPYFVLPLALGVLMFVQQKISPATGMDPMQQKMMLYMMPAMITFFMLFLPAGLCLYMFTNSALSIVQQRVIEARLRKLPAAAPPEATPKPEDTPPSAQSQAPTISSISPSRTPQRGSGRPSKAERRWRRGKR
jgi:YidC/Oxa1 family membrane protein insertase